MDTEPEASWSEDQKSLLIARIVDGELSVAEACERYRLSPDEIADWARAYRRAAHSAIDSQLTAILARHGVEASNLTAAEFTGALAELSVTDLAQTIGGARKDAIITIRHRGGESALWFEAGELVDAESGPLRGVAAAHRIFGLEEGQLAASFHPVRRDRRIHVTVAAVLLEAARRKDEARVLARCVGEPEAVFVQLPGAATNVANSPAEVAAAALFDGVRTLAEVLARSELGDLETLQLVARLLEQDYLIPRGRRAAPSGPSDAPAHATVSTLVIQLGRRESTSWWRESWAAPAVVLGLLALMAAVPLLGLVGSFNTAKEPSGQRAGSAPAAATRAVAPVTQGFILDVEADPPDAELWLDGQLTAVGSLTIWLRRDARLHELRVSAGGYVSQSLLFTDNPPRGRITLATLDEDLTDTWDEPALAARKPTERRARTGEGAR